MTVSTAVAKLRLSPAQEHLARLGGIADGRPRLTLRLRGPLDRQLLAATLERVVADHDALRTTFEPAGDGEPPEPRLHASLPPLWLAEGEAATQERVGPNLSGSATDPLLTCHLEALAVDDHRLTLTAPALAVDPGSLLVVAGELARGYVALAGSAAAVVEPAWEPLSYAEYAEWHHAQLDEGEAAEGRRFWHPHLRGGEAPWLGFAPAPDAPAGSRSVPLSAAVVTAIQRVAQECATQPEVVLSVAWQLLLARLGGAGWTRVHHHLAGRNHEELRDAVGLLAHRAPLASRWHAEESFVDALVRGAETLRSAEDWQAHAVSALRRDGDEEHTAISFEHQRWPPARRAAGVEITVEGLSAAAGSGLRLVAVEQAVGNWSARVEWASGIVSPLDGHALARLYGWFLGALTGAPERPVGDLETLDPAQRHHLLVEVNDSRRSGAEDGLMARFAAAVAAHPARPAVVCGDETLTYAELDRDSAALGTHLRALGAGPEVPVAILLSRQAAYLVAILAVLRSGAAVVPLDPEIPAARLGIILEVSGARLLVRRGEVPAGLSTPEELVHVDLDAAYGDGVAEAVGERGVSDGPAAPENLAYVLFTSGSTGEPKGVMVERRSVVNLLEALEETVYAPLGGPRVVSCNAPFTFDASVKQWVQLMAGRTLVVLRQEERLDPRRLVALLRRQGVELLDATPSHLRLVLEADWPREEDRCAVLLGGEVVPEDLWRRLDRIGGAFNVYGPTECTVDVTCQLIGSGPVSLGPPLANLRIYVVDSQLRPLPLGIPGELVIAGAGLGRGYRRRPGLTAAAYVPDPFAALQGTGGRRLYRTGDRVRWARGGGLEFLGRLDRQVKLRGFRIELGEIERHLAALDAVREAAVEVRGELGAERLVAYVSLASGGPEAAAPDTAASTPVEDQLTAALARTLPEYMLPAAWVTLDRLPLNRHGKVDRRSLPDPESVVRSAVAYEAPRTAVEGLVAEIWSELLGGGRVGRDDDFFARGGHSLIATRMIFRLRQALEVEVPVRQVFEAPRLADFAGLVDEVRRQATGSALPPLVPVPRDGDLPLSHAQERMWFLDRLDPGNAAYHVTAGYRLEGPLSAAALAAALAEVVRRHEVLRTRFVEVDGEPRQRIAAVSTLAATLALPVADLGGLAVGPRRDEARRLVERSLVAPFDLARGPLLRTLLVRLDDGDHAIAIALHHVIADGWSMDRLRREVAVLYDAFAAGRPSPLPELAVQYADYATWQRGWLSGDELGRQMDFWRQLLSGAPAQIDLPTDRPRPAVQTHRGATLSWGGGGKDRHRLGAAVRAYAGRHGATPFMVLLTAFQVLAGRWSGQGDVVVGTPIAGRSHPDLEPLIGMFANTLALRAEFGGGSFADLVAVNRSRVLAAHDHQELPFEKLVDELEPERSLNRSPVFQVMFLHQPRDLGATETHALGSEVRLRGLGEVGTAAAFDLTLATFESGDELAGAIEYNTDLYDATTVSRLATHFQSLLAAALETAEAPLLDLPLLSAPEAQQVLREWAPGPALADETAAGGEAGDALLASLARWAAERPDQPAVTWRGGPGLTWGELARRVDAGARRLVSLGVGPDSGVALLCRRTPDAVVAMLAVVRAGGFFVPLDSSFPRPRRERMLAASGARIILAEADLLADVEELGEWEAAQMCIVELGAGGEDRWPEAADGGVGAPLPPIAGLGDSLAYMLFTSGSTGLPKGVAISRRSLSIYLRSAALEYGLGPEDRILQFASWTFDTSVEEIFAPLASGCCLVLRDDDMLASVAGFLESCEALGVTVLDLPTAYWHQIVAELELGSATWPAGLRGTIIAGERALPERCAAWHRLVVPSVLWNTYGPSEATIVASWCELKPASPAAEARRLRASAPHCEASIGVPIPGSRLVVVDGRLWALSPGLSGELLIGGPQLARGYAADPARTAAVFVPDPFSGQPGARLYRTGDRVRWRPDSGDLEFQGRLDRQVKVRGFRIEPAEVESVLAVHPAVSQVAVDGREDRLIAWLEGRDGAAIPSELEMRTWLEARLPPYMVPARFVVLPSLPLTASGKVDRRRLPTPVAASASIAVYLPPQGPVEWSVAEVWAGLLEIERVGASDDFFALGGHSLLATRMVSRLRDALGVEVPVRQIFDTPTVRGLAAAVLAARQDASAVLGPALQPRRGSGPAPLSFAQERLWFLDRLEPGNAAYHVPAAYRFTDPLTVLALEQALGEVVRRHQVLRTAFSEIDGVPHQEVGAPSPYALPVVDLAGLTAADAARVEAEVTRQVVSRPFDLARGPVQRAALLRDGAQRPSTVLAFVVHHVASDGWSMEVLRAESGVLLADFAAGRPSSLPPLPVQYADYAVWQREWLQGDELQRQLRFWRDQLAAAPPALDLPTDHPRPAAQSHRGASVFRRGDEALATALGAYARQRRATPFMVLLAVFQALLARWSGQGDLVIGTPVAGRTRSEVEPLIGFFVNTLALRGKVGPRATLDSLVDDARERTLEAHRHQELPFEKLVEELEPQRSLDRSPIFQVMFALQDLPAGAAAGGQAGPRARALSTGLEVAQFDLKLAMAHAEGTLVAEWEYASDLFAASTVERMADHFETLLRGALETPRAALASQPLLSDAERRQLVAEWSGAGQAAPDLAMVFGDRPGAPAPNTLWAIFARQAELTPTADALAFLTDGGDLETWDYATLARRSLAFGAHLADLGVGPEKRVGLLLERGPELVVAILGTLATGGAYVPLDPAYPGPRIELMLADAGISVLVADPAPLASLAAADDVRRLPPGCVVLRRNGELPSDEGPATEAPTTRKPLPGNLAYVIYTSGSTGRPKGVAIDHRAAVALLAWAGQAFSTAETRSTLAATSMSFDLSIFELFAPWSTGGRVVLARDVLQLADLPAAAKVSLLNTVPSAMVELVRLAAVPDSVRVVNLAGEALPRPLADAIHALPSAPRLLDLYGPSEDTTYSTWSEVPRDGGKPAIGVPLPGGRAFVVDRHGQPSPIGVPGELYLGGSGLARGYLGRPALTAERFLPDPFAPVEAAGSRLYRTGDRARWLATGELDFLDRLDHQVKLRGFRVELGEVEAALLARSGVEEAVVVVRPWGGSDALVAYVAGAEGELAESAALRRSLADVLPAHMVPAVVVSLAELPRTPNGKLDRRALPDPAPPSMATSSRRVPPRGPLEELLAGIWSDLLVVEQIGAEDDFFALGGHSLLATRVVSRLRDALGVEMPLRWVFEAPTLRELAGRLRRERSATALPPLRAKPRDGEQAVSFAQERMWFLDRLEPGDAAYHIPAAYHFAGPLSAAALAASLGEIVRRHEVLRTFYAEVDGVPVQRVGPAGAAGALLLPRVDLSGLDGKGGVDADTADADLEARRLAAEIVARPFDLARGSVYRAVLLHLAPDADSREPVSSLVFVLHHIAADGWSMQILAAEATALLSAYGAGEPSPFPELALQYIDYAAWQRGWLAGPELERQVAFWKEQLAGAPPLLELPTDRPRPPVRSNRGAHLDWQAGEGLARDLDAFARRLSATPFMVLMAAFQALLSRWSGQGDVVVGTPVAGRNRSEIEPLIGFFVNTLALRAVLAPTDGFGDLVAQVRERSLDAHAHQDLPFEKLVDELAPQRSLAHSPLFQVMLSLQNLTAVAPAVSDGGAAAEEGAEVGVRAREWSVEAPAAQFDLKLTLEAGPHWLLGAWEYATDLFDPATVERLAGHLTRLLAGGLGEPDRPLGELPLLDEAERRQLTAWSQGDAVADAETTLWHLFARRAAAEPSAGALLFASPEGGLVTWSYGELEVRARGFAAYLATLGVAPESRVGLLMERGPELVVAILGTLGAGAAYVPLDPSYPDSRIGMMIADAGVSVLVADPEPLAALSAAEGEDGDGLPADCALVRRDGELPTAEGAVAGPLPGNLAYLIYTSGSTGRPKGVAIEQRSAAALVEWGRKLYRGAELASTLAATSASFDLSIFELFVPLASGGRVVLVEDALALAELPPEIGVSLVNTVPSAMTELLRLDAVPDSVRVINLAGEALPAALATAIHGLSASPRLLNLYGPSEDTTYSTAGEVGAGVAKPTLGRPLPGKRAHVLDPHERPTPVGVPGELYLGGIGLARGYLGRPGLTAERFVPDRFAAPEEAGARLYRTGDRARWLASGELDFLGRLDHQVKLRGFRIELGEVESALRAQPGVGETVAVVRPWGESDALVAYVAGADPAEPPPKDLREKLAALLPGHLVPAVIVPIPRLPRTPNGKVDRGALPAPGLESQRGKATYVPPRGPVEGALVAVYQNLLSSDRVGATDDFFALGGHSLLATRLISRVRQELGVDLPVRAVFQAPRLRDLARRVEAALSATASTATDRRLAGDGLVTLRGEGSGSTLYLVHAAVGTVTPYLALVDRLTAGYPVLGVEAVGAGDAVAGGRSALVELARNRVDRLRASGARGPYRLAGWSMGGLIALEMARHLTLAGEQVDALILLDSHLAETATETEANELETLASFARHLELPLDGLELRAGERELLEGLTLADDPAPAATLVRRLADEARSTGALPPTVKSAELLALYGRFRQHISAFEAYRPAPYDAPLTLIRAAAEAVVGDPLAALLKQPRVVEIPADHFTLLREPAVPAVARAIDAALAVASTADDGPRSRTGEPKS